MITVKSCPACGETKSLEMFSPSKRHSLGRAYYCRICAASKRRDHYALTATAETRARDAARMRANLSVPENAERDRARSLAWAKANAGKVNKRNAAWRAAHPERSRQFSANYRAAHPEVGREQVERRRARLANAPVNDFTVADWQELLEEFDNSCAYCGTASLPLQQEHVVALSRGGSHTKSNIVPACGPCNGRKGTRSLLEFLTIGEAA